MNLILLSAEVNPIIKKQGHEGDAFEACSTGYIKIVFALSIEVVALHMQTLIVQVEVPSLNEVIAKCEIYFKLTMFLASNK